MNQNISTEIVNFTYVNNNNKTIFFIFPLSWNKPSNLFPKNNANYEIFLFFIKSTLFSIT